MKAKQSFREFQAARRTIDGYEAMHMIRKGQARWVSDDDIRKQNQFIDQLFDLPPETSPPSSSRDVLRHRFQSCNTSFVILNQCAIQIENVDSRYPRSVDASISAAELLRPT